MNTIQLIQPMEPQRDELGYWTHPDIPDFDEDAGAYAAWLKEQQLTTSTVWLESEDVDHHAYVRYFDNENGDISAWEPSPPRGDGWFLLAIFDTEDGPVASYARRNEFAAGGSDPSIADLELALFAENQKRQDVERERDQLRVALELMLDRIPEPPEANCSCHLSPPCNDCIEYGGEREAFESAKDAIAAVKSGA